jgi:hypothetical protein
METVTLEREAPRSRGKKRLYISSVPKRESLQTIQALQALIGSINPNFIPYPRNRLHMTVFHFGNPMSVFDSIRQQASPNISIEEYRNMLSSLTQTYRVITYKMGNFSVTPQELDYFGRYVVIKIKTPLSFMKIREHLSIATQIYLRYFGVDDTYSFCYNSQDLWTAPRERYNPHITLGTTGQNITDIPQINGISIPEDVDIKMSHPYIYEGEIN